MTPPQSISEAKIYAPLKGLVVPLNQVPDAVFAKKMVGDGLAIEPMESLVCAPCTGEIVQFHEAGHAFTIRTTEKVEILVHVGINTVSLKGKGFHPIAKLGEIVNCGDPILNFDLDQVACQVKSVQVIVIHVGTHKIKPSCEAADLVQSTNDIFTVLIENQTTTDSQRSKALSNANNNTPTDGPKITNKNRRDPESDLSSVLIYKTSIHRAQGLHARPAAELVHALKNFEASIEMGKANRWANAKSLIALLSLEVGQNESVEFKILGKERAKALKVIKQIFPSDRNTDGAITGCELDTGSSGRTASGLSEAKLVGVGLAPGKALGPVVQLKDSFDDFLTKHLQNQANLDATTEETTDPDQSSASFKPARLQSQTEKIQSALAKTTSELNQLKEKLQPKQPKEAAIFSAHIELIQDPQLLSQVELAIKSGLSAAQAWKNSYEALAQTLASAKSKIIAGRASDLKDVGLRLLQNLTGYVDPLHTVLLKSGDVVVAKEILPSQAVLLADNNVAGLVTMRGGKTSHVAILARSLGVPAIVIPDTAIFKLKPGQTVIIDGDTGSLVTQPNSKDIDLVLTEVAERKATQAAYIRETQKPSSTTDGHFVAVAANVINVAEAQVAQSYAALGSGLVRTEFLFMDRNQAPSFEEELTCYKNIASHFQTAFELGLSNPEIERQRQENGSSKESSSKNSSNKDSSANHNTAESEANPHSSKTIPPVIFRTLDVGGDKPLSYLPVPKEDNPFLGIRGLRLSFEQKELFNQQLKALVSAAKDYPNIHIMFPMVTTVTEFKAAKALLLEHCQQQNVPSPPCGIMIEVPAAALQARAFAKHVDFFSIGTNDLTQYTLAMDRGHPQLASQTNGLEPAVLKLIAQTIEAAHKAKIWVGVCGGLAGQLDALAVLIGLGIDELSVSVTSVPEIKHWVRRHNLIACQALAQQALACDDVAAVMKLCNDYKEQLAVVIPNSHSLNFDQVDPEDRPLANMDDQNQGPNLAAQNFATNPNKGGHRSDSVEINY